MTETKTSNYLLIIVIISTIAMFIWTLNTMTNANKIYIPTLVSAFNG